MNNKPLFPGQRDDEEILRVLSRHPFTLVTTLALPVLLIAASVFSMTWFFSDYIFFLISFLLFIFFSTWLFVAYFVWVRDRYVITSNRVVDIEQKSLFSRSQREATIDKIQDTTIDIKGFWGSLFRYGSVTIQTAGESALVLDDISRPEEVQKIISELIRGYRDSQTKHNEGLLQKMADIIKGRISIGHQGFASPRHSDQLKELEDLSSQVVLEGGDLTNNKNIPKEGDDEVELFN